MPTILREWTHNIPARAQGILLTGIRGCDLAPKNPGTIDERYGCSTGECSAERELTAYLRWCVLYPADEREVDIPGAWFRSTPPDKDSWKPSQFGHYPLHWYSHLMHCFEIVSVYHPDEPHSSDAWSIYTRMVKALHLNVETTSELMNRLLEDRIKAGTVVS